MPERGNLEILLRVEGLHKAFGKARVLHDVNLKIALGQIVALVGPSGCGKSTLLNIILGILESTTGAVLIKQDGVPVRVTQPGPDRGIVFQNYELMPFLTVEENVTLGPDLLQTNLLDWAIGFFWPWSKWRRLRRHDLVEARKILRRMGLTPALKKYPHELSGGMQQRVALAQTLATKPYVILLDEPFGALDEAMREGLQKMLLEYYQKNIRARRTGKEAPYTVLLVTHELNEAIYVADRVIGLSQYWDWAGAGHSSCPGATIVYDKPAPIFHPEDPKEHEQFVAQRAEIRKVVFREDHLMDPHEHVTFWNDMHLNGAKGVLAS